MLTPAKVIPLDARQAELAARVARNAAVDGVHPTAFAPLSLIRASEVAQPLPSVYAPCLCLVVQGRKRAIVGSESFYYDAFNYLLVSVTLPMFGQIIDASPERPYLCMRINVDFREVGALLLQTAQSKPREQVDRAVYVARMSSELMDVALRLMRLVDTPVDLPVVGPLVLREFWYRILQGDMGDRLRSVVESEGSVQRVHRAIEIVRQHYARTLRVEELAEAAHLSVSAFHVRFKAVTSLSPLQFQKQLRLHEARRLMLTEKLDAAAAAHHVGYESPSQFNREYRRLFGAPPRRELQSLRAGRTESVIG